MNNMKKAARIVKMLATIFIVIATVSAFIYFSDLKVGASSAKTKTTKTQKKNSNVPNVASKTTKEIHEDLSNEGKTDLDKKVNEMIKFLSEEGNSDVISTYLGKDEKTQREYLKAFIKADYSTMFPKLGVSGGIDGIIKIERQGKELEYKKYDDFVNLINNNNKDVEKYFTLQFEDTNARLVVATWNIDSSGEKIYSLNSPWNYQKSLNLFAMPFDFIWAMLVAGRSKEFAYDLANLAISESNYIIITVYDTEVTNTELDSEGNEIETKENIVNMAVTKANTWLLEYEVDCNTKIGGKSESTVTTETDNTNESSEEIQPTQDYQFILDSLPENLSEQRKSIIRVALSAVGKIKYYWGGRASAPGFEGNNFGATVQDDKDGRTEKGLDCSHFVDWVCWTALGNNLRKWKYTRNFQQ